MKAIIIYLVITLYLSTITAFFKKHRLATRGRTSKDTPKKDQRCEERQVVMGPCQEWTERFWYDPFLEDCRFFIWGGNSCPEYSDVTDDDT